MGQRGVVMEYTDLDNRFSYHKPNEATGEKHQDIRQMCLSLAEDLNGILPEGREKSLVITHLEEVMFWSNAAIARSNPLD